MSREQLFQLNMHLSFMKKSEIRFQQLIIAIACIFIPILSFSQNKLSPEVSTLSGKIVGVDASGIYIFKGIPFAEPPVGNLRWKEPKPAPKWDGVKKAIDFGPNAMQLPIFGDMNFETDQFSEDCLYLNIWTPTRSFDENLPVLVYFHGGGLAAGSGSEPRYAGESMARNGIISITVNYRLGIFGFFSHPELTKESPFQSSGNYGLLDQVAALKWIKQNITAFGGDPNKITIAGESAGSFSVSALMCSPLSKDLFQQAIGSSGSLLGSHSPIELSVAEKQGIELAQKLDCKSLKDLRQLSASELLTAKFEIGITTVDGHFLTEQPIKTYQQGEQANIPLLVGWNSSEVGVDFLLRGLEPTLNNLKSALLPEYGDNISKLLETYQITTDAEVQQNGGNLASDLFIGYSTWKWFELHRQSSKRPVFRYLYMHPRPEMILSLDGKVAGLAGGLVDNKEKQKSKSPNQSKGAVHSADIEYAMGTLPTNSIYNWQPEDYIVSTIFQHYYLNFVKYGNPNGLGLPFWHSNYKNNVVSVMQINDVTYEVSNPEIDNRYRYLDNLLNE